MLQASKDIRRHTQDAYGYRHRKLGYCWMYRTAFTDLNLYWIKSALAFVFVSSFYIFFWLRVSWTLSFQVHVKLFYRIVSYDVAANGLRCLRCSSEINPFCRYGLAPNVQCSDESNVCITYVGRMMNIGKSTSLLVTVAVNLCVTTPDIQCA